MIFKRIGAGITILLVCLMASTIFTATAFAKRHVIASWYGPGFNGKKSASGERFNMHSLTAAHKRLPFGIKVRVTNPRNGKSVVVKINDRGPYVKGRTLDLSYKAAKEIGLIKPGSGRVNMDLVVYDKKKAKYIDILEIKHNPRKVMSILFKQKKTAAKVKRVVSTYHKGARVEKVVKDDDTHYRVVLKNYKGTKKASSKKSDTKQAKLLLPKVTKKAVKRASKKAEGQKVAFLYKKAKIARK